MRPPRGPGEQAGVGPVAGGEHAPGGLALGGLAADGPDPVGEVDVLDADAGDLADAGGGGGGEDDGLAPARVLVVGAGDQGSGQIFQGCPVAQGQGAARKGAELLGVVTQSRGSLPKRPAFTDAPPS